MHVSFQAVTALATSIAVLWHSVLGCCGEHGHAGTVRHNRHALSHDHVPPAASPAVPDAALRDQTESAPRGSPRRPHCDCGHSLGAAHPSVNAAIDERPSGCLPEQDDPCSCGESHCVFAATKLLPAPAFSTAIILKAFLPGCAALQRTAAASAAVAVAFTGQSVQGLRSHLRLHILRI